jgi:hypothetical protein
MHGDLIAKGVLAEWAAAKPRLGRSGGEKTGGPNVRAPRTTRSMSTKGIFGSAAAVPYMHARAAVVDGAERSARTQTPPREPREPAQVRSGSVVRYKGFLRTRASSPMMPRRNVSTHTTKITPCTMVTHAPSWER